MKFVMMEKFSRLTRLKKALIYTGASIGGLIILMFGFYLMVLWGVFGSIPKQEELANIQNYTASEIYSSDKVLLGKYYIENRTHVPLEDISPQLVQALIATEDARFYEHAGVDNRSMMRVVFKSLLLADRSSGGGSTLSQQLAKNLFPREYFSILTLPINKIKEIIIAKRLEKVYNKDEIISLYLNTVAFGENVFGIGVATQRFFSSNPKDIPLENAAVLVGMLKANTSYNPRMFPERSLERRNIVLDQMVRYNYLKPSIADSLKSLPLNLAYKNVTKTNGLAPYFRQQVGEELKEWFANNPKPDGSNWNLYTDGLKIYTTIDSRMQRYAEKAVERQMKSLQKTFDQHWKSRQLWKKTDSGILKAMKQSDRYRLMKARKVSEAEIMKAFETPVPMKIWSWEGEIEKEMSPMDSLIHYQSFLQSGLLAMEPTTGYVRAWVGGINYKQFKYDHVTSQRQVGSTFKPFVYAAAISKGIDPCERIPSEKVVYNDYKNWSPGNSDGDYEGFYSLQGGLTHSVNTVSAAVMMKAGVGYATDFAKQFGFTSNLPRDPTLVLGTADLSLKEMVGAYSAFANRGLRAVPVYITRIEDEKGNIIQEFPTKPEQIRALETSVADMMNQMLCSVVDSGTASRLRRVYGLSNQIGGKTGTTQNQTDGWFMGITPKLVVGVWVGGEDRKVRFRSIRLGQGANTALPIFANFMKQVYSSSRFKKTRYAQFESPGVSALQSMDCPMYTLHEEDEPGGLMLLIEQLKQRQEEKRRWREEKRQEQNNRKRKNKRRKSKKWENIFQKKR